ncbi:MAG TPA: chloride channel protein [Aeromicrobium sp.]|nr:chloride channel protein [Aeromicrobium sp.]
MSATPPDVPFECHEVQMSPNSNTKPESMTGPAYLKLVAIGALIGLPAAAAALLLLSAVHKAEHFFWTYLPEQLGSDGPPWYFVVGLPVAGAALVVLARRFLPGDGGHSPTAGISGDPTPLRYAPGVVLAAFGTLAFGAILGPEAPLIALGSAIGLGIVAWLKLDRSTERILGTAGSFSAISALFGGPLVAGIMLLESGLAAGSAIVLFILPGLAAAAIGYLLFVGLGSWTGLEAISLKVPDLPIYEGTRVVDLLLAIAIGVLTTLAVRVATRVAKQLEIQGPRRVGMTWTLLAGGLAVGLLAQCASLLGATYDQILFSGQSAIAETVTEGSIVILLLIIAAKGVGYAICLGCGFRGGMVFPAIFLSVAMCAICVNIFDGSITWAVAVGTAAGMAASTRLIFSALVFAILLTGTAGFDAVPATVFAALAALLTNLALDRPTEVTEPVA